MTIKAARGKDASVDHPSKTTLKILFKEILQQIQPWQAEKLSKDYRNGGTIYLDIRQNSRGMGYKTAFGAHSEPGIYTCPTCERHGETVTFDTDDEFAAHIKTHPPAPETQEAEKLTTVEKPIVVVDPAQFDEHGNYIGSKKEGTNE